MRGEAEALPCVPLTNGMACAGGCAVRAELPYALCGPAGRRKETVNR